MNNSAVDYETDLRIPCQYGSSCYRKNEDHQKKFKHPTFSKGIEKQTLKKKTGSSQNIKQKKLGFYFQKRTIDVPDDKKIKNIANANVSIKISEESSINEDQESSYVHVLEENIEDHIEHVIKEKYLERSKEECGRIIKELFCVHMPEDFYNFWSFCKHLSPDNPTEALQSIDLILIGPYDVLSGTLNEKSVDRSVTLKHWRYYYDPPEFQTVIRSTKADLFHIGYFRDDPDSFPIFVGCNDASKDPTITPIGDNLFAAVDYCIKQYEKSFTPFKKIKCSDIKTTLRNWADKNNFTLKKWTEKMCERDKNVVSRTFHRAGIVVPYNKKTELGYRPLSETNSNLNKLLKQIDESKTDEERKIHFSRLYEIVTWANIAMDEGDFGTCLELGINLFCFGSHHLHKITLQLLTSSYGLLGRNTFANIIKVHLEDRKKGNQLSIISQNTVLDK